MLPMGQFLSGLELRTKRWFIEQHELLHIIREGQPEHLSDNFYEEYGLPKPYILHPYNPNYLERIIISEIQAVYRSQTDKFPLSVLRVEDLLPYLDKRLFLIEEIEETERRFPVLRIDEKQLDVTSQDQNTIARKGLAITIANAVKKDFPNLTSKEAAQQINARLAAMGLCDKDGNPLKLEYAVKYLMSMIKPLGFTTDKAGKKPRK